MARSGCSTSIVPTTFFPSYFPTGRCLGTILLLFLSATAISVSTSWPTHLKLLMPKYKMMHHQAGIPSF